MDPSDDGGPHPATAEAVELRAALAELRPPLVVPVPDDWPAPLPPLPEGEPLRLYASRAIRAHPTLSAFEEAYRQVLKEAGHDPSREADMWDGISTPSPAHWTLAEVAKQCPIEPPPPPQPRRVVGRSQRWEGIGGYRAASYWDGWEPASFWGEPLRPPPPPSRATRLKRLGNRALRQLVAGFFEVIRTGAVELHGVPAGGQDHQRVPPFEIDDPDARMSFSRDALGPWDRTQNAVLPRFRVLRVHTPAPSLAKLPAALPAPPPVPQPALLTGKKRMSEAECVEFLRGYAERSPSHRTHTRQQLLEECKAHGVLDKQFREAVKQAFFDFPEWQKTGRRGDC